MKSHKSKKSNWKEQNFPCKICKVMTTIQRLSLRAWRRRVLLCVGISSKRVYCVHPRINKSVFGRSIPATCHSWILKMRIMIKSMMWSSVAIQTTRATWWYQRQRTVILKYGTSVTHRRTSPWRTKPAKTVSALANSIHWMPICLRLLVILLGRFRFGTCECRSRPLIFWRIIRARSLSWNGAQSRSQSSHLAPMTREFKFGIRRSSVMSNPDRIMRTGHLNYCFHTSTMIVRSRICNGDLLKMDKLIIHSKCRLHP